MKLADFALQLPEIPCCFGADSPVSGSRGPGCKLYDPHEVSCYFQPTHYKYGRISATDSRVGIKPDATLLIGGTSTNTGLSAPNARILQVSTSRYATGFVDIAIIFRARFGHLPMEM